MTVPYTPGDLALTVNQTSSPPRPHSTRRPPERRPAAVNGRRQRPLDVAFAQELDDTADGKDGKHLADVEQHIIRRVDVIEIRKDVVPDERAHEMIVMNQVNPQHRPGDAVNHRAEEVRPRQEVKEQRNRQRDGQDHGEASGFLQETILMQQKSHRVKGQYRRKQEQHHREEIAHIAFMLPLRLQRGTVQPQITADGVNKGKKQDGRI